MSITTPDLPPTLTADVIAAAIRVIHANNPPAEAVVVLTALGLVTE